MKLRRLLLLSPLALTLTTQLTAQPYAPQALLPGGLVLPLYPPDSPLLNREKLHLPEVHTPSTSVPGRISSIVGVHNPSIEFHPVDPAINTGAVIILAAGGGHNQLVIASEATDFVPFFYNYGINTVILRYRLRKDGYNPQSDAVNDARQAIRLVRANAAQWKLDPAKIGIMGFSAGAELSAATAVGYQEFDQAHPFSGISSRPDFVGILYPGPSPFARNRTAPPIPRDVPPAFLATPGSGDRVHAIWAMEYFSAMLALGVPNIEMHVYGNGRHPGDPLPNGTRMSGGLTDRGGIPLGTWQYRFLDWFRDLGFLQKPGLPTKAAQDSAAFASRP